MYIPFNYETINIIEGSYTPSVIKPYDNSAFDYWCRAFFQRAQSVIDFTLPDAWQGKIRDFFLWCLFRYGYLSILNSPKYGETFQPCTLYGRDWYYQPTDVIITNPAEEESLKLKLGEQAELLKLTPDFIGIWDVVIYYAEKMALLDNAINMSLINSKFAFILAARNKAAAQALKKVMDKINKGEPAVIVDMKLLNDPDDKDVPWQSWERGDLKSSYLTTDQLNDFRTIINDFDREIGIPVSPIQKKERLTSTEADTSVVDSKARSLVWIKTLQSSIEEVKKLYPQIKLDAKLHYEEAKVVRSDGEPDDDWTL